MSGSTSTWPCARPSSARSNGPQRDPTSVTSSITNGAHGRVCVPATVVLSTIVPRGRTSFKRRGQAGVRAGALHHDVGHALADGVAHECRRDAARLQQRELLGMLADHRHVIGQAGQHLSTQVAETSVTEHHDAIAARDRDLRRDLVGRGHRFGEHGDVGRDRVRHRCRFTCGTAMRSANAPSWLRMPSTVRLGQCVCRPALQVAQRLAGAVDLARRRAAPGGGPTRRRRRTRGRARRGTPCSP